MVFLLYAFIFIFGAIVGSFINVVSLRFGTGMPIGNSRSVCFSCGKKLSWFELIPIASFFIQRGRCLGCKSRVSIQYPAVEAITGALFAGVLWQSGIVYAMDTVYTLVDEIFILLGFILVLATVSILLLISIYDIRHKIIPDRFSALFALVAFVQMPLFIVLALLQGGIAWSTPVFLDLFAGPLLFLPFYFLWRVSDGRWMGLGDGKLAIGIGWFLGFKLGLSAIILGFWIGAVFSIALLLTQYLLTGGTLHTRSLPAHHKAITMKSEIPFAPFLILGTLIVFFFGINVLNIGSLFIF